MSTIANPLIYFLTFPFSIPGNRLYVWCWYINKTISSCYYTATALCYDCIVENNWFRLINATLKRKNFSSKKIFLCRPQEVKNGFWDSPITSVPLRTAFAVKKRSGDIVFISGRWNNHFIKLFYSFVYPERYERVNNMYLFWELRSRIRFGTMHAYTFSCRERLWNFKKMYYINTVKDILLPCFKTWYRNSLF